MNPTIDFERIKKQLGANELLFGWQKDTLRIRVLMGPPSNKCYHLSLDAKQLESTPEQMILDIINRELETNEYVTAEEFIRKGLEAAKDEQQFRIQWASQWFPRIVRREFKGLGPGLSAWTFAEPLEVWAFTIKKDLTTTNDGAELFIQACHFVWLLATRDVWPNNALGWMALRGTSYHWIIAGCLVQKWKDEDEDL